MAGVPGTEFDAAAKLSLDGLGVGSSGGDAEIVTLEGGRPTPLWPTVYWCLRCGDLPAAVRVMRLAAAQHVANPANWEKLLELAIAHEAGTLAAHTSLAWP